MLWQLLFLIVSFSLAAHEFPVPYADLPQGAEYAPLTEAPGVKCPLAHLQGAPSAIVGGCVNVINGTYTDHQTDLVIPAVEPFMIQRSYVSVDTGPGFADKNWHINHQGKASSYGYKTTYDGPFGERLIFKGSRHDTGPLKLSPEVLKKGVTNCAKGTLDARANIKNSQGEYISKKDLRITTSDGSVLSFRMDKLSKDSFSLTDHQYLSGSTVHYADNRISLYSPAGQLAAFIDKDIPDFQKSKLVTFKANDGRVLTYQYKRKSNGICLWQVIRPNGPTETFHYEDQSHPQGYDRIDRKMWPEGRFIHIDYYKDKKPNKEVNTPHAAIEHPVERDKNNSRNRNRDDRRNDKDPPSYKDEPQDPDDPLLHRVKALSAPVGTHIDPIRTHTFFYHLNNPQEKTCRVEDAYQVKTHYKWDENDRLKSIHRHRKNGQEYVRERFQWGKEGTLDHTQLISHLYGTGSAKESFCRFFTYNHKGCVNESYLFGNLTGQNTQPIILEPNGRPQENGIERYSISRLYNAQNLVVKEWDAIHTTTYDYLPGTDLIAHCFTWEHKQIKIRRFYDYDCHGQMIREIVDDGCTPEKGNFTGVTERKIRHIHHTGVWGLPAYIEEKYHDFQAGEEKLLGRVVYDYTREGWILQEDHFDSAGNFAYSLKKEYDAHGNVTLEQNAEGMQIHRKYDPNDNLILEQNPAFYITYTYDYSNRLIRAQECHPEETLGITYQYDLKGNRVSSTDSFGHETRYHYDEFDRLIAIDKPENSRWTTAYDVMGNITTLTDPNGHATRKSYTVRGQPYEINYPDGTQELNLYHANGTLAKHVARDGSYETYTYDYQDRPVRKEFFGPNGNFLYATSAHYNAFHVMEEVDPADVHTVYRYDYSGKLIHVYKGPQVNIFEYDTLGRKIRTIKKGTPEETIIEAVSYDIMDRVIEERQERIDGHVLQKTGYAYDLLGRCTHTFSYVENSPCVTRTTYDSHNTPVTVEDPDGNIIHTHIDRNYRNEKGQKVLLQEMVDPLGMKTITIYNTTRQSSRRA